MLKAFYRLPVMAFSLAVFALIPLAALTCITWHWPRPFFGLPVGIVATCVALIQMFLTWGAMHLLFKWASQRLYCHNFHYNKKT